MRSLLIPAAVAALLAATTAAAVAEVKQVRYPAVDAKLADTYAPDAAFASMQSSLAAAVAAKDPKALFALVGPTFLWMSHGELNDQFDFGRPPLDNFQSLFGFAAPAKTAEGPAPSGPLWDILATFAADKIFYQATDTLVCGPMSATVDSDIFSLAKKKINADDSVEWYFTLAVNTPVAGSPTAAGPPVGQVDRVALPVLDVFPQPVAGQPKPPVTQLQVLLPSGDAGWIPISAALPLATDRLCYAVTPDGSWKFAAFDQAE